MKLHVTLKEGPGMKKTAKIGMTLVAVLALPVALATEWVTHQEATTEAKTVAITANVIRISDPVTTGDPAIENVANEMRIYASF